jgi:hypothetical protein
MLSYMLDTQLERVPFLIRIFEKTLQNPRLLALLTSTSDAETLAEAPLYFRQNLLFPYLHGMLYCLQLREAGGQKLLDYAFRSDPPTSSEQILHPEKWLVERDPPVEIDLASLDSLMPGMVRTSEGTWGELNIGVVLAAHKDEGGVTEAAASAASGWGGDRFALWSGPKSEIGVWVTDWDTPADAREFERAARTALRDWTVVARAQRVVLWQTRGKVKRAVRRALPSSLFEAPAEHRSARAPDLTALGITEADRPTPANLAEFVQISSRLQEFAFPIDYAEYAQELRDLLADPEVAAAMVEMLEDMSAQDIAALQENPLIQEMRQKILTQTPVESVLADGVLRLPRMAVEIPVPSSEHWAALAELPEGLTPRPILMLKHDSGRVLAVLALELPTPTLLEAVAAGAEAQLEALAGFEKHSGDYVSYNSLRAYELEFSFTEQNVQLRGFQSFFLIDRYLLSLQTFAAGAESSDEAFEELRSTFSGVRRTGSDSQ